VPFVLKRGGRTLVEMDMSKRPRTLLKEQLEEMKQLKEAAERRERDLLKKCDPEVRDHLLRVRNAA